MRVTMKPARRKLSCWINRHKPCSPDFFSHELENDLFFKCLCFRFLLVRDRPTDSRTLHNFLSHKAQTLWGEGLQVFVQTVSIWAKTTLTAKEVGPLENHRIMKKGRIFSAETWLHLRRVPAAPPVRSLGPHQTFLEFSRCLLPQQFSLCSSS